MGKVPIRLKEVVYTISPFEVTVMSGLFKDMPKKFADKVKHVSLLPQFLNVSDNVPATYLCVSSLSSHSTVHGMKVMPYQEAKASVMCCVISPRHSPESDLSVLLQNWVDIGLFGALPTYLTMWCALSPAFMTCRRM